MVIRINLIIFNKPNSMKFSSHLFLISQKTVFLFHLKMHFNNLFFFQLIFLLQRGACNENWTNRSKNSGIYHLHKFILITECMIYAVFSMFKITC